MTYPFLAYVYIGYAPIYNYMKVSTKEYSLSVDELKKKLGVKGVVEYIGYNKNSTGWKKSDKVYIRVKG